MNPYLFGCLLLTVGWLAAGITLYLRRRRTDLREFWWGSGICALLGFTEPIFVPEYWAPPSVLSYKHWDLESFIFCFAVGGIVAVIPEVPGARTLFHRVDYLIWVGLKRLRASVESLLVPGVHSREPSPPADEARLTKRELRRENMLLATFFVAAFGLAMHLHANVIYKVSLTCAATAAMIGWRAPKLRWQVFAGGATFCGFYTIILVGVRLVYPSFYESYWNVKELSGLWLLGAPAEEYLFALSLGVFWAPLYETWKDEREAVPGP
jgi:hypothetical protein